MSAPFRQTADAAATKRSPPKIVFRLGGRRFVGAEIVRLHAHDSGFPKEIYTRTGVDEFWSVDPVKRTITVFQLSENSTTPRATLGEGKTLTTPLLPGLKIKVRDVFAD